MTACEVVRSHRGCQREARWEVRQVERSGRYSPQRRLSCGMHLNEVMNSESIGLGALVLPAGLVNRDG